MCLIYNDINLWLKLHRWKGFQGKTSFSCFRGQECQSGLYVPKMLRHSAALKYSHSDIKRLRRFAAFLVIYVPYFQTAGNAADAQWEDLSFDGVLKPFETLTLMLQTQFLLRGVAM